jgi:hypothetical protein
MAEELVKVPASGAMMERPSFIPTSQEGTEHMEQDDVQIPRLSIAQQMSPELEEGHSKQIKELKVGEIFNSLTQRIYGRGPLDFAIVRASRPRWVEFAPRDEGGGVVDPNVPAGDPRTEFWVDDFGKRRPPRATKFYDFVIVLEPEGAREIVALSLKSTGIAVAKALNGLIKLRNAPLYAGVYQTSSKTKKNPKGTFYQFNIQPAGWPKTQETLAFLKDLFDALKVQEVKIHTDGVHEDDSFEFGANDSAANAEM